MSEFKTPLTTIKDITPHPNPEVLRLEIAHVYGFQVVIPKGKYAVGDTVMYMPIDSVLPKDLEDFLFAPDAKIKLHNSRIRQIRIQKFPSQGMLVSSQDLQKFTGIEQLPPLETDMAGMLKVVKYEPPLPAWQQAKQPGGSRNKPLENPLLHKYNGLENIKWYPDLFKEGEEVVIQEKLHGSNVRAAILPTVIPSLGEFKALMKTLPQSHQRMTVLKSALNMLKRIVLGKLGMLPSFENCYGSNNVELTNRTGYVGYYGEDVYGNVLKKVSAFEKMNPGETIFGELIGPGIQKNYHYGLTEHHFVLFDVKVLQADGSQVWLTPDEVEAYAKERGFDFVPVLYRGPFSKALAYELTKGDSVYSPKQKIREGVVIKSVNDYNNQTMPSNKKALKYISEAYLDKDNSDFH